MRADWMFQLNNNNDNLLSVVLEAKLTSSMYTNGHEIMLNNILLDKYHTHITS